MDSTGKQPQPRQVSDQRNCVLPAAASGSASNLSVEVELGRVKMNGLERSVTSPAGHSHLGKVVALQSRRVLRGVNCKDPRFDQESLVLVLLAAGKGTRFGATPKCIQPILGRPLVRHTVDGFHELGATQVIGIVGYCADEVAVGLGPDALCVVSENSAGGTAFAAFEAFAVPGLREANPLVVISMGDRVVPASVFRRLIETHRGSGAEAALTFLTARYDPPRHRGKGRVLRSSAGHVVRVVEQQDIDAQESVLTRQALDSLTEGNCPLYIARAETLFRHLVELDNANAQGQYYLTDIVARIVQQGREVRTITTLPDDTEYDVLCADVTRPMDVPVLEAALARWVAREQRMAEAIAAIRKDRPAGQVASIARQLRDLMEMVQREDLGFDPKKPIGIGISGGRLRIAFMHPDMSRFYGPAWQMPIGAADENGSEQIVVVVQAAGDGRIHLHPFEAEYRESVNFVPADGEVMFPGAEIADWNSYEAFGTRLSEALLMSLGYFSEEEVELRRQRNHPLPPASLRVATSMRRPFALVANAIGSLRTLREGETGGRVQQYLGRGSFSGLRIACTGGIPRGGFSSSSALTVATKNAINALYGLGIDADTLVHLACQAEYGTGVRAGSLDQATEQKGRAGVGSLISSNPADGFRVLGNYRVPTERFRVTFPYTVDRDCESWRWSWGAYAESSRADGPLTSGEIRKLTGKAAEIAAILVGLALDTSFFKRIEAEIVESGELKSESERWVRETLLGLPLLVAREDLRNKVRSKRSEQVRELQRVLGLPEAAAYERAMNAEEALFAGWREPVMRRSVAGQIVVETGVPLRAMVAYLFCEVAKNGYLIHHPDEWIKWVSLSQLGDRSVMIDPERLPVPGELEATLPWEEGLCGPDKLNAWLHQCGAQPYDFNLGLSDRDLVRLEGTPIREWLGGSFFRGLALIDFAEALLKRRFGDNAVALRVNAAGQGDYVQVHYDVEMVAGDVLKAFMGRAFSERFGLPPPEDYIETCSGGGAIGLRLEAADLVSHWTRTT